MKKVSVVLVHGLRADGSCWCEIAPALIDEGYNVIAVQNPLSSLADDVAATKRAFARLEEPIVLVGHSWGGVVITEAGSDPKVKALVYVAAFAPDTDETIGGLAQDYPAAGITTLRTRGWIPLANTGRDTKIFCGRSYRKTMCVYS